MNKKILIIQALKLKLQSILGDRIHDIILFGSQAKNIENEYSDFDILIILSDKFNWREKNLIRDICYDISLDFEVLIDSKIISLFDIENKFWGKHPLITDAIKYGIHA